VHLSDVPPNGHVARVCVGGCAVGGESLGVVLRHAPPVEVARPKAGSGLVVREVERKCEITFLSREKEVYFMSDSASFVRSTSVSVNEILADVPYD
jgi:hypothetical protein